MNTNKVAAAIRKTGIKRSVRIYPGYILNNNGAEITVGYYSQTKGIHATKLEQIAEALTASNIAYKKTATHLVIAVA